MTAEEFWHDYWKTHMEEFCKLAPSNRHVFPVMEAYAQHKVAETRIAEARPVVLPAADTNSVSFRMTTTPPGKIVTHRGPTLKPNLQQGSTDGTYR